MVVMEESPVINKRNLLSISLAAAVTLFSVTPGRAQSSADASTQNATGNTQKATDQDIELLRKDVRSQKKQIIAANLQLTDKEAEQFWPVYDQYTAELVKINDAKYSALKQYANSYDTMSDAQAASLTKQILGVDDSVAQLRVRYMPIVGKVLSGKKTALFFQLDRRLVMLIDLQLAAAVPMLEP